MRFVNIFVMALAKDIYHYSQFVFVSKFDCPFIIISYVEVEQVDILKYLGSAHSFSLCRMLRYRYLVGTQSNLIIGFGTRTVSLQYYDLQYQK